MQESFTYPKGNKGKDVVVDNTFFNYSDFQIETIRQVASQPDFKNWVTVDLSLEAQKRYKETQAPRSRGQFALLHYNKGGGLIAMALGVQRVLREVATR